MSSASQLDSSKLERFSGHRQEFAVWKDKFYTHVRARDEDYQRGQLEKSKPEAKVLMMDFLAAPPTRPPEPVAGAEDTEEARWERAHWRRGFSGLQNLLNQSLPNTFLSTLPKTVSQMDPCEVWRLTERAYGDSDASTLTSLVQQWQKALTSSWKDIRSLLAQLRKIRNEANRKCAALQLNGEMFSEILLCTEVLNQLPTEVWASSIGPKAESYTIETVEAALVTLFGDKSRQDIGARQRTVVVNVARQRDDNVVKPPQKKQKVVDTSKFECFYCKQKGHAKSECQKREADRATGLFRSDIHTAPGEWNQGQGKKKKKKVGVNVAKNKYVAVAASVAKEVKGQELPTGQVESATGQDKILTAVPPDATAQGTSEKCDKILFGRPSESGDNATEFRYVGAVQQGVSADSGEDVDMSEPVEH